MYYLYAVFHNFYTVIKLSTHNNFIGYNCQQKIACSLSTKSNHIFTKIFVFDKYPTEK